MHLRGYLVNENEVIASMDRRGARIETELRVGIGRLAIKLQNLVKTAKLRGQVLKWRTGRLSGSILQGVTDEGGKTLVELEHRGWERLGEHAGEARQSYASGWEGVLKGFAERASS